MKYYYYSSIHYNSVRIQAKEITTIVMMVIVRFFDTLILVFSMVNNLILLFF
jgi:hypothetical protein